MKKSVHIYFFLFIFFSSISGILGQQENQPRAIKTFSIYGTTLLAATDINASFEFLKKGSKSWYGLTTGISMSWVLGEPFVGPHIALSAFPGNGPGHFDLKLGVAVIYQPELPIKDPLFIPVLTLGYRRFIKENSQFYRIGLGSGGLGAGYGWVF